MSILGGMNCLDTRLLYSSALRSGCLPMFADADCALGLSASASVRSSVYVTLRILLSVCVPLHYRGKVTYRFLHNQVLYLHN